MRILRGRQGQDVVESQDGLLVRSGISWQGEYRQVERSGLFPDLDLGLLVKYIVYHDSV